MKIWVRLALRFFCSRLVIDDKALHTGEGPLILACNHPNAFLDALVIAAHHPRKMYFLARGDAFKNKLPAAILSAMHMVPVYNSDDGDHITKNQATGNKCAEILKKGGVILAFPEGVSANSPNLRPLKKFTARLACEAWQHGLDDLVVQPVGIVYDSFTRIPKNITVRYAPVLRKTDCNSEAPAFYKEFNEKLAEQLTNASKQRNWRKKEESWLMQIPELLGYIIHKPFYVLCYVIARRTTAGSAFYDSVLFALLALLYPLYIIGLGLLMFVLTGQWYWWFLLIVLPLLGYVSGNSAVRKPSF